MDSEEISKENLQKNELNLEKDNKKEKDNNYYENKNLPFVSSSNKTNTNINLNTSNNTVYNTNTFTPSAKNRISQSRIQSLKDEPYKDLKNILL